MKHCIILFVLFFFCTTSIFSQRDFRNGYIVKNNNDTVVGLLNYKGNKVNAKKCQFKSSENSETHEYTPSDIKAYRFIDSKMYVTRSINEDGQEVQLFLEYLIDGIVDFYYYRDDSNKEHYYADFGDKNLQELKNEVKEFTVNDVNYTRESKEYIRLIKSKFKGSYEVAKKADNIELDHKSLINIARDYHNEVCKDQECIIYEKKIPKTISRFGLTVGINSFSLKEVGSITQDLAYLKNCKFKTTYPSFGVFYNTNLPSLNEKLHFQYEGKYSKMNIKASNSTTYGITTETNEIKLSQSVFANNFLIIYESPRGSLRPMFQVGGSLNYFFGDDYKRVNQTKFQSGTTYYTKEYTENPFSKFDIGINLGVGLVGEISDGRNIYISVRYQRGLHFIDYFKSNIFSLNLGLQLF